eukprot:TRINITY_DN310_c0_g1_i1.p1 TRINITY_DN310_c0_g1~~TRINITY_DN310_c0_g1_i1.p1  ORF type:complete len:342 (-),score=80.11 TRINITY_DN310_c0_g1_i1:35-1030(-)
MGVQGICLVNRYGMKWYEKFIAAVLRQGHIPKHVAFIMDGNRRFAEKKGLVRIEGHSLGFEKLKESLEWCMELGVEVVTVYAFSIENFKRSKEEVDALMNLAYEKFTKIIQHGDLVQKYGICVRVLGNISLLPPHLQSAIAKAIQFSRHNTKAILNICFSYTSTHEMMYAASQLAEGVEQKQLLPCDVIEEAYGACLYTAEFPDPEMVVRTSGETRLSDFLLYQSHRSQLFFLDVLWPEFTLTQFSTAILQFQRQCTQLKADQAAASGEKERLQLERDLAYLRSEDPHFDRLSAQKVQEKLGQFRQARRKRITEFLQKRQERIDAYIDSLC